ncbi:MAG: hypothetical protein ABF750_06645 [Oenococcus oeni]
MLSLKKIKDNTCYAQADLQVLPHLTKRLTNKTLNQLVQEDVFLFPETLQESEDVTGDQFILQSIDENYRTSNIMGFLAFENEQLIIASRFSKGKYDYFFQYLLQRTLRLPNILNDQTVANPNEQVLSLLSFLFPHYLKLAMRKGIFKTYVLHKYNDNDVKGTIDISRHIKINTPFIGSVAYHQREFSYDNNLTELIRHTIEFIKSQSYGSQLLKNVKNEVTAIVEITQDYEFHNREKVLRKNNEHPVKHAYFREYGDLQRLCSMILKHKKYQMGFGKERVQGILFDGAWLWEEYLNSLIGDWFYHPMNRSKKGKQWLFQNNKGEIFPDFIGQSEFPNRIVADAKYKPTKNIHGKDYLQLLAYMFRFDAKKGFYLYPEKENHQVEELKLNQGTSYEQNVQARNDIAVFKYGLKIPNEVINYDDFVRQIKRNEQDFVSRIAE